MVSGGTFRWGTRIGRLAWSWVVPCKAQMGGPPRLARSMRSEAPQYASTSKRRHGPAVAAVRPRDEKSIAQIWLVCSLCPSADCNHRHGAAVRGASCGSRSGVIATSNHLCKSTSRLVELRYGGSTECRDRCAGAVVRAGTVWWRTGGAGERWVLQPVLVDPGRASHLSSHHRNGRRRNSGI